MAATTPRPSTYTINTDATFYPGYLWVMDAEVAASSIPNQGSAGTLALTMTNMTRSTDATHGVIWSTVAASSAYGRIASMMGATTGITVVCIAKVTLAVSGIATNSVMGLYDSAGTTYQRYGLDGSDQANPGAPRLQGTEAQRINNTNHSGAWKMFAYTVNSAGAYAAHVDNATPYTGTFSNNILSIANRFSIGARDGSTTTNYSTVDYAALAIFPNTILTEANLDAIYADPWTSLGVSEGAAVELYPQLSPLYYGANLLASKSNIEVAVHEGHSLSALPDRHVTNATTDASGNLQIPGEAFTGTAADPVTVSLYWQEGNPPVDRSLIVKTTLVAA